MPVIAPVKEEAKIEYKPISLGGGSAPRTVGMPKSKKPWKVGSVRSSKHTPFNPKKWQEKMADKKKMKALRDRIREGQNSKKADVF